MTLTHKTLLGIVLAGLTSIGSALAAAPDVVRDVSGAMTQDGGIAVSWSPVNGAVSYNVYYSRQSILGNGGDYDDFESTTGNETTFVFDTPPMETGTLYVAVLAVSGTGEESDGFLSEASVVIGSTPAPLSSSALSVVATQSSSESVTTAEPLSYRTVQAVSSTGVVITFTKALESDTGITSHHFVITDSGGTILPITEIVQVDDVSILLKTGTQSQKKQYVLGLVQNIKAADGTSLTVSAPRALFDGYEASSIASSSSSSVGVYVRNPTLGGTSTAASAAFTGPSLVDVTSKKERDGSATVRVTWTPVPGAVSYMLYTAQGDGVFTETGKADASQTSAQLRKVQAKDLRVKVTAKNVAGVESEGLIQSVLEPTGTSKPLPQSGIPALGAVLAAGAFAGRRFVLRRKK